MQIELDTPQGAALGLQVLSPILIHEIPRAIEALGETYLDRRDIAVATLPTEAHEAYSVQGHVVQLFHVKQENGHIIQVSAQEIATYLTARGMNSRETYILTPIGFDHRASGYDRRCAVVTMTYFLERDGVEVALLHETIHLFVDESGDLRSIVEGYEIE